MAATTMMEVPVLFPSLEVNQTVFVVNDTECTIRKLNDHVSSSPPVAEKNGRQQQYTYGDETLLRAAASQSILQDLNKTLVTSLLAETPWILSVSLLSTDHSLDPILIYLDIGSETKQYSKTAKIQAFADEYDNVIHLALVDCRGVILKIQLNSKTLIPSNDKIIVVKTLDLMNEDIRDLVSQDAIQSCMVACLSLNRVVLAWSPFLMTVQTSVKASERTVKVWSKAKCVESMKSRRKSRLSSFLSFGGGYSEDTTVMDISPVSALCSADNDPDVVFSLHSDGILRQWKLPSDRLDPFSVKDFNIQGIPPSQYWVGSLTLTARIVENRYGAFFAMGVVISVDTAFEEASVMEKVVPTDLDDDHGTIRTSCRMYALNNAAGSADDSSYENTSITATRLHLPDGALQPIGMFFDLISQRLSLLSLFYHPETHESFFLTYHAGNVSIVVTEPTRAPLSLFLDQLAMDERQRISLLSFYGNLEANNPRDMIHEIDRRFLKYLFRPIFPKGFGSVLPPSAACIKRALRKFVPNYLNNIQKSCSIELEVIRAIYTWRRNNERGETPLKKRQVFTGLRTPDGRKVEEMDTDAGSVPGDGEDLEASIEQAKAHEGRWRQLLMEIWNTEEFERLPVLLGRPQGSDDAALIIRPGATSAVVKSPEQKRRSEIYGLDQAASSFVSDKKYANGLCEAEQYVWNITSNGGGLPSCKNPLLITHQLLKCWDGNATKTFASRDLMKIAKEPASKIDTFLQISSLDCNLPGLCCASKSEARYSSAAAYGSVAGRQRRLAAASFVERSLDSARRLLLGRLVLLTKLSFPNEVVKTANRMYLHAVGIQYTTAQLVQPPDNMSLGQAMPSSSFANRIQADRDVTGIVGGINKELALDCHLMKVSKRLLFGDASLKSSSFASRVIILGTAAMETCILIDRLQQTNVPPELEIISQNFVQNPQLSLRLLSTSVAFPRSGQTSTEIEMRKEDLARFMLKASSADPNTNRAELTAKAALDLLRFDVEDLNRSMERVNLINEHFPQSERDPLSNLLLEFIQSAIKEMRDRFPEDWICNDSSYISLWSILFFRAIISRDWDRALFACINNPDTARRIQNCRRLVIAMFDAGDLMELLKLCKTPGKDSTESWRVDLFARGIDFYEIAVDTLADGGIRDLYTDRVKANIPACDYHGALYTLHVFKDEWRQAAHALDKLYEVANQALVRPNEFVSLDEDTTTKREHLIVGDLRFAAVACYFCTALVAEKDERFVVSGENGKKMIVASFFKPRTDSNRNISTREPRKKTLDDLRCRAARTTALATLFSDDSSDSSAAKNLFQELTHNAADGIIVTELFSRGCFHGGLVLGQIIGSTQKCAYSFFDYVLLSLLSDCLVPIAVSRKCIPDRPTFAQLTQALIGTVESLHAPPILVCSRWKKPDALHRSSIREAAMILVRSLVTRYSTSSRPLGIQVARAILRFPEVEAIPSWLEKLTIRGTVEMDLPGLFALRRPDGVVDYLGDPSALVTVYSDAGLLNDACRIICTVLDSSSDRKAPSRLPEKGDMDFVPYNKIDFILNLIGGAMAAKRLAPDELAELAASKEKLEKSLMRHFSLLKTSSSGLESARALAG